MIKINKVYVSFVLMLLFSANAHSHEPTLTIVYDDEKTIYTRSELLTHPDLEEITIDYAPVYKGKKIVFSAFKVANIFEDEKIPKDALIQYWASDGYSAPLEKEYLLNRKKDKSIAYIAIEDPQKKWPPLKGRPMSAGPFYLVWFNPKLSHIPNKAWPYWIESFEVKGVLEAEYPGIMPDKSLSRHHQVRKGMQLYVKHCFSCHTINHSGAPKKGPDLNIPMNPTEYFKGETLKRLIRQPTAVRDWPGLAMSGFSEDDLSDGDIEDIIAYLKHMGGRKVSFK